MIRTSKPEEQASDSVPARPVGGAAPSTSSPAVTPVKTEQAEEKMPAAVIGPKIRFKGELVGEEDLLIQGEVDGTIDLKGNHLIIGEQGTVRANVLAQNIVIKGTVEGDIYGQERISILSSSNVQGNLVADRVTLEDGAKFKGSIDMDIADRKSDFENFNADSSISKSAGAIKKPQGKPAKGDAQS
ncbi:bactofilin family protein [Agaribacterium haliotis]|uniref:bactofilin family protein n=1 Tax=Agaribacterium haliotis TaxID=2013869 RepID=UPI000BB55A7E|nr:polymer-forming cytoskeletal protein [Agaribacterium haliotis]